MSILIRAEHLLDLGRAPEAEQLARQHLLEDSSSVPALHVLSKALNDQSRWSEAAEAGRAALAIDPESTDVRITLTESLLELEDVVTAHAIASGAVRSDPHDWRCRYSLTQTLLAGPHPRIRDALDQANECVRLAPNSPDTHNLMGLCLDGLGLEDRARACYRKALELDPQHAPAMNNLATLDLGVFRLWRASRGLTSALASDPQSATVQQNLRVLIQRLAYRLFIAVVAAAAVVGILLAATDRWLPRAGAGVVLIGLCTWLAHSSRHHLPRGMSRSWRTLAGQLSARTWLFVGFDAVALVCVSCMSFAPRPIAIGFGAALLVAVRLGALLMIGGAIVGAVVSLVRR